MTSPTRGASTLRRCPGRSVPRRRLDGQPGAQDHRDQGEGDQDADLDVVARREAHQGERSSQKQRQGRPAAVDRRKRPSRIVQAVAKVDAEGPRARQQHFPDGVAELQPVHEEVPAQPRQGDHPQPGNGVERRAPDAHHGESGDRAHHRQRDGVGEARHHDEVAAAAGQHQHGHRQAAGADHEADPGAALRHGGFLSLDHGPPTAAATRCPMKSTISSVRPG